MSLFIYIYFLAVSTLLLLIFVIIYQNSFRFVENFSFMLKTVGFILFLSSLLFVYSFSIYLKFYGYGNVSLFNGLFILNYYVYSTSAFIIFFSFILILFFSFFSETYPINSFEVLFLFLAVVIGALLFVSANDLVSLYLGFELQTIPTYILLALYKTTRYSVEASLKYFILSLFASGMLLMAFAIIYFVSGLTNFVELKVFFTLFSNSFAFTSSGPIPGDFLFICFAITLMLVCFLLKVGAAPFHFWVPDIYSGSSAPVIFILATISKFSTMIVLFNLLVVTFKDFSWFWGNLICICAVLSIIIGSLGAFGSSKISRFIAFAGTAHVGFALFCFFTVTYQVGFFCLLFYLVSYLFSIAVFLFVWASFSINNYPINLLIEFSGLFNVNKRLAFIFSVALFSLAGIPTLAGFFGKFLVLKILVFGQYFLLAVFVFILSVISAVYYLRVVSAIYFERFTRKDVKFFDILKVNIFIKTLLYFLILAIFCLPLVLLFI